jgi:type IX secretion system PorP/SprF family membrane protein
MKKIFTIIALSAFTLPAFAQQDKQLTHYFFNNITTNPGAAGTNENICVGLTLREQWTGFPGNPQTGAFTLSMPLRPGLGGIGLVLIGDQLGASRDMSVKASYAYHIPFGADRKRILSFGLNLGILNKGIDFTQFNTSNGATYVNALDPYLNGATANTSVMKPDLGFGIFYKSPTLYFGLSGQELLAGQLVYNSGTATATSHIVRHYYLTGGYNYPLGSSKSWVLKPSFLVKTDATATQFDFNLLAEWKEQIWGGLTFRYQDAATAMVGFYALKNSKHTLKVGYAYDYTTSGLGEPAQGGSNGSHELYLGYCIKKPVPPRVTYHDPTWL